MSRPDLRVGCERSRKEPFEQLTLLQFVTFTGTRASAWKASTLEKSHFEQLTLLQFVTFTGTRASAWKASTLEKSHFEQLTLLLF
jgi:hypothetical protein